MKEELKGPEVTDVLVAAVHEMGENNEMVFTVYLINKREDVLEQTLVTSKGYSSDGETKTSTLRRVLENIEPKSAVKIEPIIPDVFGLNNEYWVSFWIGTTMYDKKFIFLPETIQESNFMTVPILNKNGVIVG